MGTHSIVENMASRAELQSETPPQKVSVHETMQLLYQEVRKSKVSGGAKEQSQSQATVFFATGFGIAFLLRAKMEYHKKANILCQGKGIEAAHSHLGKYRHSRIRRPL